MRHVGEQILSDLMRFRRTPKSQAQCKDLECPHCISMHLPKILAAIENNRPLICVLPAFPGKSPNTEKVLGHLPDHAEQLALNFLGKLCQKIKKYYAPGIKVILCADGRVFSDIIGMDEAHVSAYQNEIEQIIKKNSLFDISTFQLENVYNNLDFAQMRIELMQSYGQSVANLKEKIQKGKNSSSAIDEQESHRMYCGITKFLFEDSVHQKQTKSRTTLQKESRSKAYEVISRSNAWSKLIEERFPEAIRLSIHPQTCGSKKLGIRLIANESWMTPWHGVAVDTNNGYILLKRSEAISLGAKLVYSPSGEPSHYQLITNNNFFLEESV